MFELKLVERGSLGEGVACELKGCWIKSCWVLCPALGPSLDTRLSEWPVGQTRTNPMIIMAVHETPIASYPKLALGQQNADKKVITEWPVSQTRTNPMIIMAVHETPIASYPKLALGQQNADKKVIIVQL